MRRRAALSSGPPSKSTAPASGATSPMSRRNSVDLPQPDGPSSTVVRPRAKLEVDLDGELPAEGLAYRAERKHPRIIRQNRRPLSDGPLVHPTNPDPYPRRRAGDDAGHFGASSWLTQVASVR